MSFEQAVVGEVELALAAAQVATQVAEREAANFDRSSWTSLWNPGRRSNEKHRRTFRLYTFFRWKEKRENPSGHPRKDSELTRRVSCIKASRNLQRGATDYERFSFDARTSEG